MGSRERRERDRQRVRRAILDVARDIAAREGWQSVTIRKVAERIEYSAPTVYEHFPSKDAILLQLVREGLALLLGDLQAARTAAATPRESLLAMALAYWRFAWEHSELYQVMFGLGVPFECAQDPEEAVDVLGLVHSTLEELARSSGVPIGDPAGEVQILWGTLHGLVALTMAGRLSSDPDGGVHLVRQAVDHLLASWSVSGKG